MISVDPRNLVGGLFVSLVGGAFAMSARTLPEGPPGQIGPGFFPFAVGLIAVGLGLVVMATALRKTSIFPRVPLRPILGIFAAVLVFGVLIRTTGLVPALFATTAVSAAGSDKSRLMPVLALSVAVAFGCWLVFIVMLGLPISPFRSPF